MEECVGTCSHLSLMGMWGGYGIRLPFCFFALVLSSFVMIDLSQPAHSYFEIWSADLRARISDLRCLSLTLGHHFVCA